MKIIVGWDLNCGPLCCFNLLLYITTTALVPTHNLPNALLLIPRYLSACRDLEPGEEILREKMLLIGPQLATMPVCLACYRWVDGSYLCTKCGWPLCGKKCEKNSGEHSTECKIFQDKKFK